MRELSIWKLRQFPVKRPRISYLRSLPSGVVVLNKDLFGAV